MEWETNATLLQGRALAGREQMPELFFLGLEIFLGVRAGSDFAGNTLHDQHSGAFQGFNLLGIVRQQAHARDSQGLEDLSWEREVAVVVLVAEALVGLARGGAL